MAASPRTCELVYVVAKIAFGQAELDNVLSKNPCRGVKKLRVPRKTVQTLSEEQARMFLDEARGDRLYALSAPAVTKGLRQGELFALHWADIDLDTYSHLLHSMQRDAAERLDDLLAETKKVS